MPAFCDVALPVPLDRVFTYATSEACQPAIGCRVVVPFRNEKMIGIVTRLHDDPPPVEAKQIQMVMDAEPVLAADLMQLAGWISQYYLAPLGEVLRTMLPLMAEVRSHVLYRITDTGRKILFESSQVGSSRRSRLPEEAQDIEYRVLNALEQGDAVKIASLRSATKATAISSCRHGAQEMDCPRNRRHATRRAKSGSICRPGAPRTRRFYAFAAP